MKDRPARMMKTISLEVTSMTSGMMMNIMPMAMNTAMTPPTRLLVSAAPMARAPCPFCVMG